MGIRTIGVEVNELNSGVTLLEVVVFIDIKSAILAEEESTIIASSSNKTRVVRILRSFGGVAVEELSNQVSTATVATPFLSCATTNYA